MKNIIGKKFGKLLVLELLLDVFVGKYKYKYKEKTEIRERKVTKQMWKCQCDCGNISNVSYYHLVNGNTKSCGCLHKRKGKDSPFFKGYGDIPLNYYTTIKRGAKGGGILNRKEKIFDVTIEYLWDLFKQQNGKCKLSGLDIGFDGTTKENKHKLTSKFTASLDRIDSSKGYVNGNVQWVHKYVNIMKNELSNAEFVTLCKRVAELH